MNRIYESLLKKLPHAPSLFLAARIQSRFDTGYWERVDGIEFEPFHALHFSRENPDLLCFFPTIQAVAADKLRQIRPGKYLSLFLDGTDEDIQELAEGYKKDSWTFRVIERPTADQYEEIYTHIHPQISGSCMRYPAEEFDSDIHPVRVYAHPEGPGIAFLQDSQGKYIARSLVRSAAYLRVYTAPPKGIPQDLVEKRFIRSLEAAGYRPDPGCLLGARLRRREYRDRLVCPYIDGRYQSLADRGEYLVITQSGGIEATATGGLVSAEPPYDCECDQCGGGIRFEDGDYCGTGDGEHTYCCSGCFYAAGWRYADCEHECHVHDLIRAGDGGTFCGEECAHRAHYEECSDCGRWYHMDDVSYTVDGDLLCCRCQEGYEVCEDCGRLEKTRFTSEKGGYIFCSECIEKENPVEEVERRACYYANPELPEVYG